MSITDPDELVTRFYELYSFPLGRPPDTSALAALFLDDARIRSATTDGQGHEQVFDVGAPEYLARLADMVGHSHAQGIPLTRRELWRRTDAYGNIAQVWSSYEAAMGPANEPLLGYAVFAFELCRVGGAWRIAGVASHTARRHEPIPSRYLGPAASASGGPAA